MRLRRKLAAVLALVAALVIAAPVSAVRFGQPDAGEHPYVGELLFYVPDAVDPRFTDPGAWFTCSGTLLNSTTVLTAGHCTFGIGLNGKSTTDGGKDTTAAQGGVGGNDVWISFSATPNFSILPPSAGFAPNNNEGRYDAWSDALNASSEWHRATAYPHPLYNDLQFWTHDAGILKLHETVSMSKYGALPPLNVLNQYARRAHATHTFEIVGYGLTKSLPKLQVGGDTRLKGLVTLHTLNAHPRLSYAIFSNTPSNRASGGLCFGDSGGPIFQSSTSNVVVAVNSFVNNLNCAGVSGGYRIDQTDDLNFIRSKL